MRKITKRIMALMLSLVMIFGCVPSFINEASAIEINTVADILDTVPGGFPSSLDEAWQNEDGDKVFFNNSKLFFYSSSNNYDKVDAELNSDTNATKKDNGYEVQIITDTISFNMANDELESITYTVPIKGNLQGTYKPVKTIADILDTVPGGFPNEPSTGWVSEDEYTTFCAGDTLWFQNTSESDTINTNTKLTLNADSNYENTDAQITFVMTDEKLTSIVSTKTNYAGTYEPAVKTITVNYEKPKTIEELVSFIGSTNAITVNANASSISNFTKQEIEGSPLYLVANKNPEFLGYFVILTPITFEDDVHCNAVDRVYLRDIDLGKPTKSLNDVLLIASTIDYVVAKEANSILVIEKFDFSKKLNITASLNANMKVIDAINSIKDNITDDGIVRNYSIKEDPDGDPLDDDATLEAGKKYYLNGIIKNVVDSICYNQVSINNKVLPYDSPANPEKPNSFSNTMYSNNSEDCGFLVNYEFTATSNSSGSSKKYKTNNTSDSAEKISGSGKKGSTRTITPIEGKKVSSVIVTDKDGNKVDVTLNEDGTYSFKQPASDVNIEVNYKNREITLNIGSTEAEVDGEKSNLDVCPVIRNDRTMLPIRYVAENLGAKVEWNEKKPDYVAITRGDTKIEITLGSDIMLVNGKEVKLDSVAFAENDRTYLPVRAISEALNAIVEWNESEPNVVKIFER